LCAEEVSHRESKKNNINYLDANIYILSFLPCSIVRDCYAYDVVQGELKAALFYADAYVIDWNRFWTDWNRLKWLKLVLD
jgi:hypothetical protein